MVCFPHYCVFVGWGGMVWSSDIVHVVLIQWEERSNLRVKVLEFNPRPGKTCTLCCVNENVDII